MADLELLPAAPAAPAAKSLSDDEVLAHTAALWKYQDPFYFIGQRNGFPDSRRYAQGVQCLCVRDDLV